MPNTILIVEDDATLCEMLALNLRSAGYQVWTAGDGAAGIELARTQAPDLILLDLMLPELDGLTVCRSLRRASDVPIMILTARSGELDKIVGLESGADDYMTKPFSLRELIARVRAMLRRTRMAETKTEVKTDTMTIGNIKIDIARHQVTKGGTTVELTPKEFDLLAFLAGNKGFVFSRDQLLEKVWGYEFAGDTRTVDVHIRWLRQKIEDNPEAPVHLITVRGTGYKLEG